MSDTAARRETRIQAMAAAVVAIATREVNGRHAGSWLHDLLDLHWRQLEKMI